MALYSRQKFWKFRHPRYAYYILQKTSPLILTLNSTIQLLESFHEQADAVMMQKLSILFISIWVTVPYFCLRLNDVIGGTHGVGATVHV